VSIKSLIRGSKFDIVSPQLVTGYGLSLKFMPEVCLVVGQDIQT